MRRKSKKVLRALKVKLAENETTVVNLAKEIGVSRNTIYMSIIRGSSSGLVFEWFKKNLGIDLSENKKG